MECSDGTKSTTASLFAAQHGVIGRRQALATGLTTWMIKGRVRNGTWTVVDLAGVLTPDQLEAALDSALRERLAAAGYLQRRLAGGGRKGTGVLGELAEDRASERPHESPKEAELSRLLVTAGLPRPVRQFE